MSDSFLETNAPLVMLMEAAKSGDEDQFEIKAAGFKIHAEKLQEVKLRILFEGRYLVFSVIHAFWSHCVSITFLHNFLQNAHFSIFLEMVYWEICVSDH